MSNMSSPARFGAIPSVRVFGVRIHAVTVADLLALFAAIIDRDERALVLHVNVHGMNLAYEQPWLVDCLNRADLVYCDGDGVVLGARLLGQHLPERLTLADWLWQLAEFAQARGDSLFLLGAREGVAARAAERLQERFPNLKIAGTHHGYFDKASDSAENQAVLDLIRKRRPDIVIVGFGMPIQEQWLCDNWPRLDAHIAISAGAIFDFISGELKRAPTWMNDHGLEWLGRLVVEPNRLWQRYLVGNPLFLGRVLRQRFGERLQRG
jgi:N-acetylglucosaminyldiphosphoundecaprenol N-acetyl-beta-D-mannosaminyltransferase